MTTLRHFRRSRSSLGSRNLSFPDPASSASPFSPGETVFSEGEPCAGLYIVESGHVRIFESSTGGREQVLSIDGPGSSVAELPVFDGGNYPASVTAVDDATVLFVSKQDFQPPLQRTDAGSVTAARSNM